MASRRITSVCHFCDATRAPSSAGMFRRSFPSAQRRLISFRVTLHRPLSLRDVNPKKSTIPSLPYLALRTNHRRFAHTPSSAEKNPANPPPPPNNPEENQEATIIEPAGDSVYSSGDVADLDSLVAAIDRHVFQDLGKALPQEDQVIGALGALQRLAMGGERPAEGSRPAASHLSEGSAEAILSFAGAEVAGADTTAAAAPAASTAAAAAVNAQGAEAGPAKVPRGKGLSATVQAQLAAKENPPVHPVMDVAYNVLSHPAVFISPAVLSAYVSLAATARDPSTIPSMFRKYSTKPIMSAPGGEPREPNPAAAKFAIPISTAKAALDVAIAARNLPKALEVVDTSVGAKAFLRRKTMTQAVPFWAVCGAVPVGLWKVASWLATFDGNFLHSTATGWAFTLLCCYTVYTGTIGMTALLTYNDHMLRVTWIPGFPLRQRWYMEESRRMADKVAMAWGFQNAQEWGLEQGWEWQYLRRWCGVRGMIVDDSTVLEAKEIRIGGH